MAMQAGVQTSKILILLGAGVSGSIILRHGRLSDLIAQLHDLLKGAEGVESTPYKYDGAQLAAQIRQLANEIKELSMANPVTIFNGDSNSSYASYLVPAAAVGAMGYCYMWWKGWSFSDVMFVTKKNMADAVASVSKQLDDLSDTLAATKKHLSKKIATMDWKVDELNETSNMILNDVTEMRSSISKIGFDFKELNELISGIEGKIETLESKQDVTLSGLWHLCNIAGVKDSTSTKVFQNVGARLPIDGRKSSTDNSLSGLRFLTEEKEVTNVIHKPAMAKEIAEMAKPEEDRPKPAVVTRSRVHRTYPSGISWVSDAAGLS